MTNRTIFIENADTYKQRALDLRNRGITVNPHASWDRMHQAMHRARNANVGPGTWALCLAQARAAWASAKREALNDYAVAVLNGPRSDVYDDIPF